MILAYEGEAAVAGLDNGLVFFDGNDVVDRLRGSTWPDALAAIFGAKGFALLDLDGGQRRVSRLVFAEPADLFRFFTALDGEVVGTAYRNLIFLSFHIYWTTERCSRRRL
jgi:hypothetical protein